MTQLDPRGIAVTTLKVRDLPRFLKAIEQVAAELASGDIACALMRNIDAVIEATAIGAGVDRAWLEDQTPDVLAMLASKVLEVNADFFVRRVLPVIQSTAAHLAQTASGGTSGSPPSSMPDSPTAT
jgi:hypothetical protein